MKRVGYFLSPKGLKPSPGGAGEFAGFDKVSDKVSDKGAQPGTDL
jgi:hypothetical protein